MTDKPTVSQLIDFLSMFRGDVEVCISIDTSTCDKDHGSRTFSTTFNRDHSTENGELVMFFNGYHNDQ